MKFQLLYKLDGHEAVFVENPTEWLMEFHRQDRQVARDELFEIIARDAAVPGPRWAVVLVVVSTVFVGIDMNFGIGPPMLFETMIFREGVPGLNIKSQTWDEAAQVHREMVTFVQGGK